MRLLTFEFASNTLHRKSIKCPFVGRIKSSRRVPRFANREVLQPTIIVLRKLDGSGCPLRSLHVYVAV